MEIRNILNVCGLGNLFYVESPNFSVQWLKSHVARSLQDQFIQSWQAEVRHKEICTLYKSFKTDFVFENYLVKLSRQQSLTLCKDRTGNHRLLVTLGRHTNIYTPWAQRYCTFCTSSQMGDEVHVLLECTNIDIVQLRKRYLPKYYQIRPSVFKFVTLMESLSNNPRLARKVSLLCQSINRMSK